MLTYDITLLLYTHIRKITEKGEITMSHNVEALRAFIESHKKGTVLNVATSMYATNTTDVDFSFDFNSTASACRSVINSGLVSGHCGWRYYELTVL